MPPSRPLLCLGFAALVTAHYGFALAAPAPNPPYLQVAASSVDPDWPEQLDENHRRARAARRQEDAHREPATSRSSHDARSDNVHPPQASGEPTGSHLAPATSDEPVRHYEASGINSVDPDWPTGLGTAEGVAAARSAARPSVNATNQGPSSVDPDWPVSDAR